MGLVVAAAALVVGVRWREPAATLVSARKLRPDTWIATVDEAVQANAVAARVLGLEDAEGWKKEMRAFADAARGLLTSAGAAAVNDAALGQAKELAALLGFLEKRWPNDTDQTDAASLLPIRPNRVVVLLGNHFSGSEELHRALAQHPLAVSLTTSVSEEAAEWSCLLYTSDAADD